MRMAENQGLQVYCTTNVCLWEVMSSDIELNLYFSCHQNIMWAPSSKVLIFTF